jgi:hypothetical protein
MIIRNARIALLVASAAVGVTIAQGAHAAPTTADLIPSGPIVGPLGPDCFGSYVSLTNVIYAQPRPAITFGTSGNDVIIGSDGHDVIYGLGGDDRICAGEGWDEVYGGLENEVWGSSDADHIDGGPGVDVLHGGWDDDEIHGGSNFTPADMYPYHDFLYGDRGDDTLFGETGRDVVDGGTGHDYCDGGTGMAGGQAEDDSVTAYCDTRVNYESII